MDYLRKKKRIWRLIRGLLFAFWLSALLHGVGWDNRLGCYLLSHGREYTEASGLFILLAVSIVLFSRRGRTAAIDGLEYVLRYTWLSLTLLICQMLQPVASILRLVTLCVGAASWMDVWIIPELARRAVLRLESIGRKGSITRVAEVTDRIGEDVVWVVLAIIGIPLVLLSGTLTIFILWQVLFALDIRSDAWEEHAIILSFLLLADAGLLTAFVTAARRLRRKQPPGVHGNGTG